MGSEKSLLSFRNKKLYQLPLAVLETLCSEILISGNSENLSKETHYPLVEDLFPGAGPIGGIYSCLQKIKNPLALVLSCDIPNISAEYMKFLLRYKDQATLICGINSKNFPEALAGVYHRKLLPVIQKQVVDRNFRMSDLVSRAGALLVDPSEAGFDADRLFMNINTQEDYEKLLSGN